jgi:hypothetical protein
MKKEDSTFLSKKNEAVDIIDVIRKLRNDLIKDFLDERMLISYLSTQYRIMDLSNVKIEFIKADLKKLLISPVYIELYKPIMEDYRVTESVGLTERNEKLFYYEIEVVLKKYIY